jgi:hypothetical protein
MQARAIEHRSIASMIVSMKPLSFPGRYEDAAGVEPIVWRIERSQGSSPPGFIIRTTIRSVDLSGGGFDSLWSDDPTGGDRLPLDATGDLGACRLFGDLPCTFMIDGERRADVIRFELDHRPGSLGAPNSLRLWRELDGTTYSVVDDWFEDGLQRLEATLPATHRLVSCVTCLYSDYSPGGHGLIGISCHRDAKEQYLAVRSKSDYWRVPITEDVPETHLCPQWVRRVRGTGYRG